MQMPDCYDPVRRAENLEMKKDRYAKRLSKCALCDDVLTPGSIYREASGKRVCQYCFEQLEEYTEIVEDIC